MKRLLHAAVFIIVRNLKVVTTAMRYTHNDSMDDAINHCKQIVSTTTGDMNHSAI
jgi:hypothetical protein